MARRKARNATARGARSIAVGGDVIRSILVTGDKNRVFVGDYELLGDAYIDPWSVFKRVRLERFAAREWLEAEVDRFLAESECGYLVLEAQAGLGKTAFLAHLAKERGYLHHFVELARGSEGVAPGLKNLAAQLVRACELAPYNLDEVLPPAAGTRPDFLATLLAKAASRRRDGARIVLVVDGLDEAGTPPGHNVLGLPEVLPEGVFFLVSQRPVPVQLSAEVPLELFPLGATDKHNLDDVRAYLSQAATWEGVAGALEESGYEESDFVETLVEKSEGVWIYLHYVLSEIEQGKHRPLLLDALPNGLWQYYARFWRRWRQEHAGEWYDLHLPFLSTLAAVQEDAPIEVLCALAGVQAGPQLEALVEEEWRPFLAVEEGDERRYRPYHASLRDFFEGGFDMKGMSSADQAFARQLASQTREAQVGIADRYLSSWGGLDQGLPGLQDKRLHDLDDRYGLRHLAQHLAAAGRDKDLHLLLRLDGDARGEPARGRSNLWLEVRDSVADLGGYLTDIAIAWRRAEEADGDISRGETIAQIGLEIRYALLIASVRTLTRRVPGPLTIALVEEGIWPLEHGLAHAYELGDLGERIECVARLAARLDDAERSKVLADLLATAKACDHDDIRARALTTLAPYLPEKEKIKTLKHAWRIVRSNKYNPYFSLDSYAYLLQLIPQLQEPELEKIRTEALSLAYEESSGRENLVELVPHLPEPQRSQFLQNALTAARRKGFGVSAELLAKLATYLSEPERSDVLEKALAEARSLDQFGPGWQLKGLASLAPHLPEEHKRELLRELVPAVRREELWFGKAESLLTLALELPDPERATLLKEALAATRAIQDEWTRAEALLGLSAHLSEPKKGQVLADVLGAARAVENPSDRVKALLAVAPHFAEPERNQILREALDTRRASGWSVGTPEFAAVARYLPEPEQSEILESALEAVWNEHEDYRAGAIGGVAPYLTERQFDTVVTMSRYLFPYEWDRADAFEILARHLPDRLVEDALGYAFQIELEPPRAQAVAALARRLPEGRAVERALDAAREMKGMAERAEVLAAAAGRVQDPEKKEKVVDEALSAAKAVSEADDRARALASVVQHLNEPEKTQVVTEILAYIAASGAEKEKTRSEVLERLGPYVPDSLAADVLGSARAIMGGIHALAALIPRLDESLLAEAVKAAGSVAFGDRALIAVRDRLSRLPAPRFHDIWSEALHEFARQGRSILLRDLRVLAPLIAARGGTDGVEETVNAIHDVGRWLP